MNRADRRRRLKDDHRLVARGLDRDVLEPAQVMALMRVLHALMEESRDAGTIAPLMSFFTANLTAAERAGPRKAIACRIGCSHCCHAWVSARAPEVLFVKRAIAPQERETVRAAVEDAFAVTGTLDVAERSKIALPCPLLRDNRCQVYAARPATCRTAVSGDAALCAIAFRPGADPVGIPTPDFYIAMRSGYSMALAGALKRAGYGALSYELNGALRAALARADAEGAWLAGEDVFAASAAEAGDPFAHPRNRRLYEESWVG
jgi:hypothetical protein